MDKNGHQRIHVHVTIYENHLTQIAETHEG